jgi:thiol:disulfide interchange protein/DsbC/DsbD-like thiol-disulfide interchange protein
MCAKASDVRVCPFAGEQAEAAVGLPKAGAVPPAAEVSMDLFSMRASLSKAVTGLAGALLCWLPALGMAQTTVVTEHVRAELLAHAPDGVVPGRTVRLGLQLAHQPHWHTYWRNPGDSGLATTFDWQLPPGVQPGDVEWPTPTRLPIGPLMNYGYEGTVLLPVAVALPADFRGDVLGVKLRADWLVCKEICIPESGEFALQLPVGPAITQHARAFDEASAARPKTLSAVKANARVEGPSVLLQLDGLPAPWRQAPLEFFPQTEGVFDNATPVAQRWEGARWIGKVTVSAQRSESPAVIEAVLKAPGEVAGVHVSAPLVPAWPGQVAAPAAQAATAPPAVPAPTPLLVTLGLAMLGGMLLNLMPCVFPVLSLKVLGFAKGGQSRRSLAAGGLAYTGGVVASFVLLAGALLALRAGGEQLGWGFQLQSPPFVATLAVLFTLIGLNLAGVFEVGSVLPSSLATLRSRHPMVDHALTGALAVAVASPCTAPFMGVALGAALTLPTAQALAVFAALGLGMALPYLAVACFPGLTQRLPRPGAWMLRFKVFMAFPMFATVVWLLWVLGHQAGVDGAIALLGLLVAVAFAAWALGTPASTRWGRMGLGLLSLGVLAAAGTWALPSLRADVGVSSADSADADASINANAVWQPWSPAAVAAAQAQGRPVFVDFTAAWCVTCQLNKRTTLSDTEVLGDFARRGVVLLRADWTRRDPRITEELARLNRSGVPVYALYQPGTNTPLVLSEILTPSMVREALTGLPDAAQAAR